MQKNIFVAFLTTIILLLAVGCHRCDNCLHGGSCDGNGGCSCVDPWSGRNCDTSCVLGLEGYNCATPSKVKFFGVWNCTSKDPLGNSQSYQIKFSDTTNAVKMVMQNFNNKGYKVVCTLTGKEKFDVQEQFSTGGLRATVSGNAILRGGTLTLYITEDGATYFGTAKLQ